MREPSDAARRWLNQRSALRCGMFPRDRCSCCFGVLRVETAVGNGWCPACVVKAEEAVAG